MSELRTGRFIEVHDVNETTSRWVDITSIKSIGRQENKVEKPKKGEPHFTEYAVLERKPCRGMTVTEAPDDIRKWCENYYEQQQG